MPIHFYDFCAQPNSTNTPWIWSSYNQILFLSRRIAWEANYFAIAYINKYIGSYGIDIWKQYWTHRRLFIVDKKLSAASIPNHLRTRMSMVSIHFWSISPRFITPLSITYHMIEKQSAQKCHNCLEDRSAQYLCLGDAHTRI